MTVSPGPTSPNHALQRIAPRVTLAAADHAGAAPIPHVADFEFVWRHHTPSMNRTILLSVFGAAFAIAPLHAQPKTRKARPIEPPTQAASPATPRVHDFQGDDISLVLRMLARSAKLNLVVSDEVTGTVNMRIEDKTPREAIEIIAEAKELILVETKGIIYVRPKYPPPPGTPKAHQPERLHAPLAGILRSLPERRTRSGVDGKRNSLFAA